MMESSQKNPAEATVEALLASASTSSDWSVDLNTERDNLIDNPQNIRKNDLEIGQNLPLDKSSSVTSDVYVDKSDVQDNNILGVGRNVNPLDSVSKSPSQDSGVSCAADDPTEVDILIIPSVKSEDTLITSADDKETESKKTEDECAVDDPIDVDIWTLPSVKSEDSLITCVDDNETESKKSEDDEDEESYAGVKWGKSSSLGSFREDINRSSPQKDERDEAMERVMNGKFKSLVSKLLKTVGIVNLDKEGESWVDIVSSLTWTAASFVKPAAAEGKAMDLTGYVKVKCVPTGLPSESTFIRGLVFKKHAARKNMPTKCTKPKLLLIQERPGHSSGISSLSMIQDNMEDDRIKLRAHLDACQPNVVLMEDSAPREVLEAILQMGGIVVCDMKLHRLERIARCIGSPIWSAAGNTQSKKLKRCDELNFEKIGEKDQIGEGAKKSKTLMFLVGSPKHMDCTILLKGSRIEVLKKIKCVVQCAVVMAYHYIMETSFLVDQKVLFSSISSDGGAEPGNEASEIYSSISDNEMVHPEAYPVGRTGPTLSNHIHDDKHAFKSAVILIDQYSSGGTDSLSFSNEKNFSCESVSAETVNIPISGGTPHESIQIDGGEHENLSLHYKAAGLDVMGTLESPAEQNAEPLLPLGDRDSDTKAAGSVSVIHTNEEPWLSGTKPSGNSEEKKLIDTDDNSQPLSSKESASDLQIDSSDGGDYNDRKVDISAVFESESFLVLMSSKNVMTESVCKKIHLTHIKFYKNFDIPLGGFLRDDILNKSNLCKACGQHSEAHDYYYVHHNKQLTIRVKQIPGEHLPGESEGKLWMWSRCGKCKPEKEGETNTTKLVLVSNAACRLSFGKFLELGFSNYSSCSRLSKCGHFLNKDFLFFFGFGSMVSMFTYSSFAKYTISVPPHKLEFNNPFGSGWLQKEIDDVYNLSNSFFLEMSGNLKIIQATYSGSTLNINDSIKDFIGIENMLAEEMSDFEESIKNIKNTCIKSGHPVRYLLGLNRLRWELYLEACIWNRRLNLLHSAESASANTAPISDAVLEKPNLLRYQNKESASKSPVPDAVASTLFSDENSHKIIETCTDLDVQIEAISGSDVQIEAISGSDVQIGAISSSDVQIEAISDSDVQIEAISGPDAQIEAISDQEELNIDMSIMEIVSLPSEKLNLKDPIEPAIGHISTTGSTHTEKNPMLISSNEVTENAKKAFTQPASKMEISRGRWIWNPFFEIREKCAKDLHNKTHLPSVLDSLRSDHLHLPKSLSTVYEIIGEVGSIVHIPLYSDKSDDYIVSHYDNEISSGIACALALLNNVHAPQSEGGKPTHTDKSSISSDSSMSPSAPSMSLLESRFASFDGLNLMASSNRIHPEVPLGTEAHPGKAKHSVVCLYADEFRCFRNKCCPSELDYISSLSRCENWDAKGGKSKAVFAKTLDGRFIIKEIKSIEFESFVKFGSDYLKYMKKSFETGNETCLVKILGIYQVIVRQPKGGKEVKQCLMVTENLTFGRSFSRQYDLKGALYARYNATGVSTGDVLLDQNFVQDMKNSPLYVGQKAKRLLQRAVWNDTAFLTSINVMDYSLLVGVDPNGTEFVCGIIDYLRQYTLDKQIETLYKSSLVVPKNVSPTIISPKEYKKRFRKFIDTHFLTVPDYWCVWRSSNPCGLCASVASEER